MVTKNQRIAGSRKSVCEASSYQTQNTGRRSPRGERGLKFDVKCGRHVQAESLPTRGAWIEIRRPCCG